MRKPPTERTKKHGSIPFNAGNNVLNMEFDLNRPRCLIASAAIFYTSDEPDVKLIVSKVCKRYKKYITSILNSEKQIVILEHPNYIEQSNRFSITLDVAALYDEHLTKGKLMEIGDNIAAVLESMTMELNANWVLLTKTIKGKRHGEAKKISN